MNEFQQNRLIEYACLLAGIDVDQFYEKSRKAEIIEARVLTAYGLHLMGYDDTASAGVIRRHRTTIIHYREQWIWELGTVKTYDLIKDFVENGNEIAGFYKKVRGILRKHLPYKFRIDNIAKEIVENYEASRTDKTQIQP